MRLIDADAILKADENSDKALVLGSGKALEIAYALLKKKVADAPTVDAVPVVHGRWISWEEAGNFVPSPDRHECSVCHDAAQVLVNGFELLSDYCPNCGAKMDGGDGDAKSV